MNILRPRRDVYDHGRFDGLMEAVHRIERHRLLWGTHDAGAAKMLTEIEEDLRQAAEAV